MSTITATVRFFASFVEKFSEAEVPSSNNRSFTNDLFNSNMNISPTTTPPASKAWADELIGNQTLDLTALTRLVGPTVDATGLKLQAILINNLDASDPLIVAAGVTNGYDLSCDAGSSSSAAGEKTVAPGGNYLEFFNDALADVAADAKTLEITAPGDFQIMLIFG